jgi:origin recognition complex subunit 3
MKSPGQGRKYLDYDLQALHAHVRHLEADQVIVAFQDSEAFDTGLLADLIMLFKYGDFCRLVLRSCN